MENNLVKIRGRLVREPRVREVDGKYGKNLSCSFTLAVNGERGTNFLPCSAWGNAAEVVSHRHKGDLFGVIGFLRSFSYEKNGGMVYGLEVCVEGVTGLLAASGASGEVNNW